MDYVDFLFSVAWLWFRGVYSISCLIDGASAVFVGFLGRRFCFFLVRPVGVCPRSLLCFFLSLGAAGAFFISLIFLSISISWLLAHPDLRLDGDKRVAFHGFRYRCGIFFFLSPDPLSPVLVGLLA